MKIKIITLISSLCLSIGLTVGILSLSAYIQQQTSYTKSGNIKYSDRMVTYTFSNINSLKMKIDELKKTESPIDSNTIINFLDTSSLDIENSVYVLSLLDICSYRAGYTDKWHNTVKDSHSYKSDYFSLTLNNLFSLSNTTFVQKTSLLYTDYFVYPHYLNDSFSLEFNCDIEKYTIRFMSNSSSLPVLTSTLIPTTKINLIAYYQTNKSKIDTYFELFCKSSTLERLNK